MDNAINRRQVAENENFRKTNLWPHTMPHSKYPEIPLYRNFRGSISWFTVIKPEVDHNVRNKINHLEIFKHSPK